MALALSADAVLRGATAADDPGVAAMICGLYVEDPGARPIAEADALKTLGYLRAHPAAGRALVIAARATLGAASDAAASETRATLGAASDAAASVTRATLGAASDAAASETRAPLGAASDAAASETRATLGAASDAAELLGYALVVQFWSNELGGRVALLDELYVVPAARGRGLGAALVTALADRRLAGLEDIVAIDLEVTPDNDRARALYRRLGFAPQKNAGMRRRLSNP